MLLITRGCRQILIKFIEGCDVALATNLLILMLISIQEYLMEFLQLGYGRL